MDSLKSMMNNLSQDYDKREGSLFFDVLKPVSIEIDLLHHELELSLKRRFAKFATGKDLDLIADMQGVYRKKATYSQGTVTIIGEIGTDIEIGTKVASDTVMFTVIEHVTLINTTAKVKVRADIPGDIGNVPIGAINSFPITIEGLTEVKNEEAFFGGNDEESDESLRERYYLKIRHPATSGNEAHYKQWALEVNGVGNAKVFGLHQGPGTVKVVIVDNKMNSATSELIQATKKHIEEVRPVGANVTVESAKNKSMTITASIKITKDSDVEIVKNKYTEAIRSYFKQISFSVNYVSIAKLGSILLATDDVIDYTELKLNAGTSNIELTDIEIPLLADVQIEVVQ
ncbi:baseplate J/gp47 family protein [Filifactor alocis]|uniref:baseplate J/gp47 family protein n=1 Tax=Filifactor alocis TaxID=143361 RepID=UPI003F9F0AD0